MQEAKIVFMPDRDLYYNSQTKADSAAADILDKEIHLNFWKYCDVKDDEQMAELGFIADPTCSAKHDNLTFDRLEALVALFGYTALGSRAYRNEERVGANGKPVYAIVDGLKERQYDQVARPEFWQEIREKLQEDNLLGVLINKGAWHYTAVSKFMKGCSQWERNATRRLRSVSYAYIDTYPHKVQECLNLDKMIKYLRTNGDIDSVIYVYDQPGAYNSVAASRLRRLHSMPGGHRRT
jgi:hypothetical protein